MIDAMRPLHATIRHLPGTLNSLGWRASARKAWHVVGLKLRLHGATRLRAATPKPGFFRAHARRVIAIPNDGWSSEWMAYGQALPPGTRSQVPDWHSPLGSPNSSPPSEPWWSIPEVAAGQDVKDVWEFSRFDWLVCMAQRVACGDEMEARRLRHWIADWVARNPPFLGRNWQCGQEASIRVLHLALTSMLLRESADPEPSLLELVRVHLRRIAATRSYAMSQRNNHATSEAAALFVGGAWLERHGDTLGADLGTAGRELLERAILDITSPDGVLSQYSPNYQRLFLDTVSVVELWRLTFGLERFSTRIIDRIRASVRWMDAVVDSRTGDAPNIGGNDGAMLLPIGPTTYRNFRPCVWLAGSLFQQPVSASLDTPSRELLSWLGVPPGEAAKPSESALFREGGFAIARYGGFRAILRLPVFRFRPAHADALHLDLWIDGCNVLRDSGSYRYSGPRADIEWFPSTAAHSTVEFDDRSQMPRLGRFLFGAWLMPREIDFRPIREGEGTICASYVDAWGASHRRRLEWRPGLIQVADEISGFRKHAVLRWHLAPLCWSIRHNRVSADGLRMSVQIDGQPCELEMLTSPRSIYYGEKDQTPMIVARTQAAGTFTTMVEWNP